MRFRKAAIIGVGLIGGSLGLAIKERGLAEVVTGVGRRKSSIRRAFACGAIDEATTDPLRGTKGADLVVIATPVSSIPAIAHLISMNLTEGALLTDVGSTKGQIVTEIEKCLPKKVFFVGSHPLAGSEKRGVDFAVKDLFNDSMVVITKTKKTDKKALKTIGEFWKAVGASRVVVKSPAQHDRIVAQISHLPHIVATALIRAVTSQSLEFASTGFKDTTRIAASDPDIWKDICMANKREILKFLDSYERSLGRIKNFIRDGKSYQLQREFAKSKSVREKLK